MSRSPSASKYDVAAWILAGVTLVLVLKLRLLPALLAGLLVYELVHILAPRLHIVRIGEQWRKVLAVTLLSAIIVLLITLGIAGVLAFLRSDTGSLPALLGKMADILDSSRARLPAWVAERLPANPAALRATAADWLRLHADELRSVGQGFGLALAHVLIGLIIGAMISLREARQDGVHRPLAAALSERARRLGEAFRRIVFAQVRISALNTLFTGIYLGVVLPLLGIHLPLTKTMIAGHLHRRPAAGDRQPDFQHRHRHRQPQLTRQARRSARWGSWCSSTSSSTSSTRASSAARSAHGCGSCCSPCW